MSFLLSSTLYKWMALALLGVCLVVGGGDGSARAQAPYPITREPFTCPFHLPDSHAEVEGETYRCGKVIVPQERTRPDGPKVKLAFVLLKSWSDKPASVPLLYLEGGPGARTLDMAPVRAVHFDAVREERDIILFDPRGVGWSEPLFECPAQFEQTVGQLADCAQRARAAGLVLETFDTPTNAADAVDVLTALGYDKANLYGVSYGTRVALQVVREFGGRVQSLVLDSPYPTDVLAYEERPAVEHAAALRVFQDCRADALCSGAFPDLEPRFFELLAKLDAAPIQLDELSRVDGAALAEFVNGTTQNTARAAFVPLVIKELEAGKLDTYRRVLSGELGAAAESLEPIRYDQIFEQALGFILSGYPPEQARRTSDALAKLAQTARGKEELYAFIAEYLTGEDAGQLNALVAMMTPHEVMSLYKRNRENQFLLDEGVNFAVLLAVECREELPYNDLDEVLANAAVLPLAPYLDLGREEAMRPECAELQIDPLDESFKTPVKSALPALVMTGGYDAQTGPGWAQRAANNLAESVLVTFPWDHGVLAHPCAPAIVAQFMNDPRGGLDTRCIQPIRFALEPPPPSPDQLGGNWLLEEMGPRQATRRVLPGTTVNLRFEDGRFDGSSGCATYSGEYRVRGRTITFGPMQIAREACAPEVLAQEQRYFAALDLPGSFSVEGELLNVRFSGGRGILTFRRALALKPTITAAPATRTAPKTATPTRAVGSASVLGSQWRLTAFVGPSGIIELAPNSVVTLHFGPGGAVTGNAGCNTFLGMYRQEGSRLSITPLTVTEIACVDAVLMQQETAFMEALRKITAFEIRGNSLALIYDNGSGRLELIKL